MVLLGSYNFVLPDWTDDLHVVEMNITVVKDQLTRLINTVLQLKPMPTNGIDLLERSFDERKYRFEGFGEAYPRHCSNVLLRDLSEDIQTARAHDIVNSSQEMGMA